MVDLRLLKLVFILDSYFSVFLAGKSLDKFLFVTGTVDGISRSFTWKSMEGLKTQGKGKGFLQPMCRDHAASKYRKASHEVEITRSK